MKICQTEKKIDKNQEALVKMLRKIRRRLTGNETKIRKKNKKQDLKRLKNVLGKMEKSDKNTKIADNNENG